ncbi:MAG TPA: hypothetical protein VMJ70_08815, partial [Candidatus Sulfotelmatobacter sp.]|nr:hypothetical protein [Candidatus Sulfotelmatobacter sp.]
FVAWSDRRGPVPQIYLQHFDAAGNIADSSGVAVTSAPLAQRRPRLLSDGAGGVFLAWEDSSATSGRHLRAQRFDSSLQAQWGSGVAVTPGVAADQIYVALASDEAGGLFLDWIDRRSGSYQVYAVRLDAGGGAVSPWPAGGEPIAAGPNIVPGPSGSFYASGGTTATHVQADGTLAPGIPAQGVALCTGNCGPIETGAYLAADGTGGAIVAWDEWRPGPNPRQELEHSFAAKIGETGIVATLASLVSAEASPGEARLEWQLGEPATIDVERAESASGSAVAWSSLARASSDASGRLIVADTSVRPGTRYGYRLVKSEGATVAVLGETWLDVPAASTLSLAGARPNPTSGELSLAFSLRDGSPATLELLDVSGRRVASRRIETLGAGGHVVRFGEASRLAPGIYTARLTQGGRAVTAHVAVVR